MTSTVAAGKDDPTATFPQSGRAQQPLGGPPYDEVVARSRMEPGTSQVRGTLTGHQVAVLVRRRQQNLVGHGLAQRVEEAALQVGLAPLAVCAAAARRR